MKFNPKIPKRGLFSAGILFNYDQQGYSKLTLFNLNIAGSYSYFINKKNIITAGALVGYSNRGFDTDDLTWDNNWDPVTGVYDPRRPNGEDFESLRFSYLESGVGLNYRYQYAPRTNIMLGGSLFHLLQPEQNFSTASTDKLDMRISFLAILNLKIASPLDIQFDFLHQQQDVYKETIVGGLLKLYLSNKISKIRSTWRITF
ncbi:MAG: type IX secretion system membrane protein PorP/SprF [Saprospiraceae bacterium]